MNENVNYYNVTYFCPKCNNQFSEQYKKREKIPILKPCLRCLFFAPESGVAQLRMISTFFVGESMARKHEVANPDPLLVALSAF